MTRGVCPDHRPKWIRCTRCWEDTMSFRRRYAGFDVWKCNRCGATRLRLPRIRH